MRIAKWIGLACLGLIILFTITVSILLARIDKQHLKQAVAQKLQAHLNSQLTIQGDLDWSIFPSVVFKLDKISLANPHGFKTDTPLAKLKTLELQVAFFPLLSKQVVFKKILLDGLQVDLQDRPQGSNWQVAIRPSITTTSSKPTSDVLNATQTYQAWLEQLSFNQIRLRHVDINYTTQRSVWSVKDFEVNVKNLALNKNAPIALSGTIQHQQSKAPFELSGDLKLKPDAFSFKIKQASWQNSPIHGQAEGKIAEQSYQFKLHAESLRLDPWITSSSQQTKPETRQAPTTAEQLKLQAQAAQKKAKPVPFSKSLQIQGDLKVDTLHWRDLTITQLKAPIKIKMQTLFIGPVKASVGDGRYQGQFGLQFTTHKWQFKQQLADFPSQQAISLLALQAMGWLGPVFDKLTIAGTLDLDTFLQGYLEKDKFLKTLRGNGKVKLTAATFGNFNGQRLIETGLDMLSHRKRTSEPADDQLKADLRARFKVKRGIIENDDLIISMRPYRIDGRGKLNLSSNRINYQLSGYKTTRDRLGKRRPIPIRITGPINDAQIKLDVKKLLGNSFREKIGARFKKQWDKIF